MMLSNRGITVNAVPIGVAAETLGVHPRTLRLYEKAGLIKPRRRNGRRLYAPTDLVWVRCLRDIVHARKISLSALPRLLKYEGCWEIRGCSAVERKSCPGRRGPGACWEKLRRCCRRGRDVCRTCEVRTERG